MFENREFSKVSLVVLIIIIVVLLSVAGSSALMLNMSYFEVGILEEHQDEYQHIVDDIVTQIDSAENLVSSLNDNGDIQTIISEQHDSEAVLNVLYFSIDFNNLFENEIEEMLFENLTIYTSNDTVTLEQKFEQITPDIEAKEWYVRITESRRPSSIHIEDGEIYFLYRFQITDNPHEYVNLGVAKLDLSHFNTIDPEVVKIMVANGAQESVDNIYGERRLDNMFSHYLEIQESDYLGNEMLLVYELIPGTAIGRTRLLIAADKVGFVSEFFKYTSIIFGVISVIVLIALFRFNYLRNIDKSFTDLSPDDIQNIIETNRTGKVDQLVKGLYEKIESLVQRNQELDFINQKKESEKTEAEMKALLSQISPHYIFNLLNSIHKRAIMKNEMESAKMILLMSRQLRHSLEWKDPLVTIQDEINHIKSYIELQQYYFDIHCAFNFNIDENLYRVKIPKLIYQTLIENALKHGVRTSPFHIKLEDGEDYIRFTVSNEVEDEPRVTKTRITEALEAKAIFDDKHGIGLRNMTKRLQYYYGDDYHIVVETVKQSVSITIMIPHKS